MTKRYGPITTIVYALPLAAEGSVTDRLHASTTELIALLGALADGAFGRPLVLVLTSGAVHARPGDRIDLGACVLPGLIRTAVRETDAPTIRLLDLPAGRADWPRAVRDELADRDSTGIVAAREGRRWHPKLSPVPSEQPAGGANPVIPGGRYLVTGGLGGIAHNLAGYLVATYGVRLLLVGRSEAGAEKAERLAELAALGDVVYERLDVSDARALEDAVTAAEKRWGGSPLDGVLHCAGADPTSQWAELERHMIENESVRTFATHYRAKVTGTLALARLLESRPQASLVLFGSVNGEFGGHAFGAYSAANSFLVGFADHWRHERGREVQCLAWSMWNGVGMNRDQPTAAARSQGFRTIEPVDGLRQFLAARAAPHHYLLIGLDPTNPAILRHLTEDRLGIGEIVVGYASEAGPLDIRTAVEAALGEHLIPIRLVELPGIPRGARGEVDAVRLLREAAPGKRRRAHTPPATDTERLLAAIWARALGRPEIGREDSFFELGGNSLRATRLLAMVDDDLGVRVPTQALYENPTLAGMASLISRDAAHG